VEEQSQRKKHLDESQ